MTAAALADTSVFVARESGRPLDAAALPDALAASIISIGELRAGVLAADAIATRDQRLSTLEAGLAMDPLPVDDAVAAAWARLRVELRARGKSMPINDSWIAATALAHIRSRAIQCQCPCPGPTWQHRVYYGHGEGDGVPAR